MVFLVFYREVLRYNLGASKTAFSQFVFQFIIYQPTYLPALHSVSYGRSHKIKSEWKVSDLRTRSICSLVSKVLVAPRELCSMHDRGDSAASAVGCSVPRHPPGPQRKLLVPSLRTLVKVRLCVIFPGLRNILQGKHRALRHYSFMTSGGNIETDWPTMYLAVLTLKSLN